MTNYETDHLKLSYLTEARGFCGTSSSRPIYILGMQAGFKNKCIIIIVILSCNNNLLHKQGAGIVNEHFLYAIGYRFKTDYYTFRILYIIHMATK